MKEQRSVEQVRRLLAALGRSATRIEPLPPQGRSRPDVLVEIDGQRIAIETTDYHGDEKEEGGSILRRQEQQDAAAGLIKTYAVQTDPLPGLVKRVKEKTGKRYEPSGVHELWLAIFAGVPQVGAVASTFLPRIFLNLDKLSEQTTQLLESSQFSRCYLFCEMAVKGSGLYSWTRGSQWHETTIFQRTGDSTQTPDFWDIQKLFLNSKK